jgi:hypothetical protein
MHDQWLHTLYPISLKQRYRTVNVITGVRFGAVKELIDDMEIARISRDGQHPFLGLNNLHNC